MSLSVKALLLDLDGVLYIGQEPLPGAIEAFGRLRETGLPIAGVTNTTTQANSHILDKLRSLGFDFTSGEIFTPAALAVQCIGSETASLFIRDQLREDFRGVAEDDEHLSFIVMGDIGSAGYNPAKLQRIFELVTEGAELLALHKNRFWQKPEGLVLDLGTYVAAIEYATGKQATVLGKPSASFFHLICEQLNARPEESVMVGDDIESDIGGAMDAGLKAVLVKTGKYREVFAKQTGIKPNLTIPSIADLPDALSLLKSIACPFPAGDQCNREMTCG